MRRWLDDDVENSMSDNDDDDNHAHHQTLVR
jgi:hypothetical protein